MFRHIAVFLYYKLDQNITQTHSALNNFPEILRWAIHVGVVFPSTPRGKQMRKEISLDLLVKSRLKRWGQRPPGVTPRRKESWLRGRPAEDDTKLSSPFLKIPGSSRLRTLPDGLWLNFGGTY